MNNWTKKLRNSLHLLLLAAALTATGALVVACGGGGDGGGGGSVAAQNFGEITAKGSVTVNGVKFETTGATVVMDGGTPPVGDDSQLRVGMVVGVEGVMNADGVTGTATKVTFDDTLQGAVVTKTPGTTTGTATLTVMGKQVIVAQDTRIDDSGGIKSLDNVLVNGMVEVSGGVDDQGRIVATHIELKAPGEVSEVTGEVTSANPLVVSGITVATTGATTFSNFPAGTTTPAVGNLVEVKGSFINNTLNAVSIELKTGIQNDDNLHFEGFVISGSANSFVLQGHHLNQELTVNTTASTIFMGGIKDDVVVGTKLEVEGALTGSTVVATKVKFKENVRIRIASGAEDLVREGIELSLPTIIVIEDATTRRTGSNPNLSLIPTGTDLEIRGRLNRDGSKVIATRLVINDVRAANKLNDVELRGPITAPIGSGNSSLTILGVTVAIPSTGVIFRPNDDNGTDSLTTSPAEFFAQIKVGTVVKVKGTVVNNVFTATEFELED